MCNIGILPIVLLFEKNVAFVSPGLSEFSLMTAAVIYQSDSLKRKYLT